MEATDTSADCVNLVIITNPLTPIESRQTYHREWENKPLSEFVGNLNGEWAIGTSHNGNVAKEDLETTFVRPGEFVIMTPILHGGGGGNAGKTILRMVAMIALTYVTMGLASGAGIAGMGVGIGGASVAGGMSAASAAVAIGVQVGGSLLINAVLPPQQASADNFATEATYGLDGAKTTSKEGLIVPIVAGEYWIGGNVVSTFVDNTSGDQQYLNMLLALGEGPFEEFSEIEINEQPIENFTNLSIDQRRGTSEQAVIPWFNDIYTPVNRFVKLPSVDYDPTENTYTDQQRLTALTNAVVGSEAVVHTTTFPADMVRLDFLLPLGQGRNRGSGDYDPTTVRMWIGFREAGTTDAWEPLGVDYEPRPPTSRFPTQIDTETGELEFTPESWLYPDDVSPKTFQATFPNRATRGAVRRSFITGELDRTKFYEFKMLNPHEDDVAGDLTSVNRRIDLTDVNHVLRDDIRYPYTALMGMRILMSDQLNSPPSVRMKVKGIMCQVFNEATGLFELKWTDNPAWIAYTCMTNTRWGGGIDPARFKLSYYREWALFCESNNLTFNGVIPSASNIIDGLKPVFKAGRAAPVRTGTRHSVSIERERDMSALFGSGNIMKGSLKISWSSMTERANEVQVSYYDKEDYNKKKTIIIEDELARVRGDDPRPTELDLKGVDNRDQAAREGKFALNMNSLSRSITFDAPIESISVTLGDVFGVSHDMPNWGTSGRLKEGSTDTVVNLDRDVEMLAGKSYQLLLRLDARPIFSGVINQIQGYAVYIVGYNPTIHEASRLFDFVSDHEIAETLAPNGAGHYGVLLRSAAGLTVSQTVVMMQTDYVEVKNVVLEEGTTNTITLTSSLPLAPAEYINFAFGEVEQSVQKYTCRGISGDGEFKRTITALEYNPLVFDDVVVNLPVVTIPNNDLIGNVDFQGFTATLFQSEGVYRYNVEARWSSDQQSYEKAEVWVRINSQGEFKSLGSFVSNYTVVAEHLDFIEMTLVPVDRWGKKPFRENVTVHEFTVNLNDGRNLVAPINVTATATSDSIYVDWTPASVDDDTGLVVANADRPGIFKVYVEGLGLAENAPMNEGLIDWVALSAVPWTQGGFPQVAVVNATYFNYSGLTADSIYRIWVQEIHPHYPDVVSGIAPSATGIFAQTVSGTELFPEGIKAIHLNTDLLEIISYQTDVKLNEIGDRVSTILLDGALAADEVTIIEEAIEDPNTGLSAHGTAIEALDVFVGMTDNGPTSTSYKLTALTSTVEDPVSGVVASAGAIDSLDTFVGYTAAGPLSIATKVASLESTITGKASANAVNILTTRVEDTEDGVNAQASLLTSLDTTVGGYGTSIDVLAASVNGIEAEYSVTINANGNVSGFQLIGGGGTSSFVVEADTFKVSTPGQPDNEVFAIDTVTNKVMMKNGIVKSIQSYNFTSGVSGFYIGPSLFDPELGYAEFNDIVARGNITASSLTIDEMVVTNNITSNAVSIPEGVVGTTRTMSSASTSFLNVGSNSVNPAGGKIQAVFSAEISSSGDWEGQLKISVGGSPKSTRNIGLRVGGGSIVTNMPVVIYYTTANKSASTAITVDVRNTGAHGSFTIKNCYLNTTALKK